MQHPAEISVEQLLAQCTVKRTRGSGPGGQHRNKVETAIVIEHLPTKVIGQASEKRSQERNRETAVARLRVNLAIRVRTATKRTTPSDRLKSRTSQGKLRINQLHFDYAAVLAETLDLIEQHEYDVPQVASIAGLSTSQLVKFVKTCPEALVAINRQRSKLGLSRIR